VSPCRQRCACLMGPFLFTPLPLLIPQFVNAGSHPTHFFFGTPEAFSFLSFFLPSLTVICLERSVTFHQRALKDSLAFLTLLFFGVRPDQDVNLGRASTLSAPTPSFAPPSRKPPSTQLHSRTNQASLTCLPGFFPLDDCRECPPFNLPLSFSPLSSGHPRPSADCLFSLG